MIFGMRMFLVSLEAGMTEDEVRARVVLAALHDLGVPYSWGGNDPLVDGGLDCSGAVLRWLRAGGIDLQDQTADRLHASLAAIGEGGVGDVAFYGRDGVATHVALVIAPDGLAVIGANGGGAPRRDETRSAYLDRMRAAGARVRIEDERMGGASYRRDLLGFGKIPFELATAGIAQG